MANEIKVLHICSYYICDSFYSSFFSHMSKKNVKNNSYTFANVNMKAENKSLQGQVSYCFNTFDRIFFYRKHKKVWNDFLQHSDLLNCQLIHAHSLFSNGYIAWKASKLINVPYIVTVRYPDILTFFKYMPHLRKLGRLIIKDSAAVTFLSPVFLEKTLSYLSKEEQEDLRKKAYIIPNGIDDFWITNRRTTPHKNPENKKIRILFAGKINKNKNLDILIKIGSILQKKGYIVLITVAGEIQDKLYEIKIKRCNFIKYVGVCREKQLKELYDQADIFLLLSHKESFGLVYAEALSQGVPIIYTKGQGFDEQFPNGEVGYGVSDKDANQAVCAIEKILCDYGSYSYRAINGTLRFDWNIISDKVRLLYCDTLKNFNIQKKFAN